MQPIFDYFASSHFVKECLLVMLPRVCLHLIRENDGLQAMYRQLKICYFLGKHGSQRLPVHKSNRTQVNNIWRRWKIPWRKCSWWNLQRPELLIRGVDLNHSIIPLILANTAGVRGAFKTSLIFGIFRIPHSHTMEHSFSAAIILLSQETSSFIWC